MEQESQMWFWQQDLILIVLTESKMGLVLKNISMNFIQLSN